MNFLGWITEEYELSYVAGKLMGYRFTIDGKPLEFIDYIPLSGYDIEEVDYLSDTQDIMDAPYLACCTCGIVGCDAVHAVVKFEGDSVFWTVFQHCRKPMPLGKYCFDRAQYCQAIQSLLDHVKENKSKEGQ